MCVEQWSFLHCCSVDYGVCDVCLCVCALKRMDRRRWLRDVWPEKNEKQNAANSNRMLFIIIMIILYLSVHILLLSSLLFLPVPRIDDQKGKIQYQRSKYKFKGYTLVEKWHCL